MSVSEPVAPAVDDEFESDPIPESSEPTPEAEEPSKETPQEEDAQRPESQPGEEEQEPENLSESQRVNWRAMRTKLKRQEMELARLRQQQPGQPAERPASTTPATEKPAASGDKFQFDVPEPDIDTFEGTSAEFKKALKDWRDQRDEARDSWVSERTKREQEQEQRQKLQAAREKQQQEALGKLNERYETEYAELSAEIPDFERAMNINVPGIKAFDPTTGKEQALPLGVWLYRTPGGLRVGYHLAKNPEVAQKMNELQFAGQIDEMHYELIALKKELTSSPAPQQETTSEQPRRNRKPPSRMGPGSGSSVEDDEFE